MLAGNWVISQYLAKIVIANFHIYQTILTSALNFRFHNRQKKTPIPREFSKIAALKPATSLTWTFSLISFKVFQEFNLKVH